MTTRCYNLQVKKIVKETEDAISIYFDHPKDKIEYQSGQFLTVVLNLKGETVRRSYSLCTSPSVDSDLAVTVKRVEGGLVSNHLNDHLKEEDTLEMMEPMGHFTTDYNKQNKRHVIMFGGGSGITPLMSIAKSMLHEEPESIVSLIYCNRDIDSIIFKLALEQLQTKFEGRFHVIHVLDDAPLNWQGPSGLLNREMLIKLFERIPDWGIERSTYLMCGPEGMMKNVETMLADLHIPPEKIFKESFVAGIIDKPEAVEDDQEIKTREVTVVLDGEEHKFEVEPGNSILETGLDLGIDLPYSCQSGLCTACRCKCISGKVKMDEEEGLSQKEMEEGYVLICVGHPATDGIVLEVG